MALQNYSLATLIEQYIAIYSMQKIDKKPHYGYTSLRG